MKLAEHEHPLTLVDLQVQYAEEDEDEGEEEEEDDDDEGGDTIKKEEFSPVACARCHQVINMYHRYYYKCMEASSCDFSLHKFCVELPSMLYHSLHPHPLYLRLNDIGLLDCCVCMQNITIGEMWYLCNDDDCYFRIDKNCAVEVGKKIIHHPCHPHSLMSAIPKPILCLCDACGKEHKGIFFLCTISTCNSFSIHSECAFLPKTLLIQQRTDGAFYHTHPLTISYSFPDEDQEAKHNPNCRVCGGYFYPRLWLYKCEKCMYYAHVDCATSRGEPFMSILLSPGFGKTFKNYKDVDYPRLLHLPFLDETYSLPQQNYSFKETGSQTVIVDKKVNLQHLSHQHPLILIDQTQCNNSNSIGQTSSDSTTIINSWLLSKCHNPMKKIQLLCNGCLRPIMSTMPFYVCVESCNNFALHEWCTQLPPKIENHPGHPQHPLHLIYSNIPDRFFGVFRCEVCDLICNGFTYYCVECKFYVDVTCGFLPKEITHEAHPNHLLSLVQKSYDERCHMCFMSSHWYNRELRLLYNCNLCDVSIEPRCAFLLSKTIRHKYDKHPMHISYLPIENHKSEYFCEICEEDLNPHESFYHCQVCVQSVHAACAPVILQSETHTNNIGILCRDKIYSFINIKFGGILNTDGHQHPLSFVQGIESDGTCLMCRHTLQFEMIFKCFKCKFAVCYECNMKLWILQDV